MKSQPFKKWHLIALLIIVGLSFSYKIYSMFWKTAMIRIGGQEVKVLIADTVERRFKGWSGRKDMGKYNGMLFVFSKQSRYSMVMRDMRFPLDIVWVVDGQIADIAPNVQPEPGREESELTVYSSRLPANVVIELPAGFASEYGLKIGDVVKVAE